MSNSDSTNILLFKAIGINIYYRSKLASVALGGTIFMFEILKYRTTNLSQKTVSKVSTVKPKKYWYKWYYGHMKHRFIQIISLNR